MWDVQGNTLAAYTHTAAGNVKTHAPGDGPAGSYTYNAREWVTDLNYAGTFRSTLTYDGVGNVTRQVYRHGNAAAKTADYEYDDLHRITDFDLTGGVSRDYAYDRSGNITSVAAGSSTLTYNYSAGSTPNRLDSTTGTGGQTYAYNPNGWMTRKGTSALTYDYRGLTTGYGTAVYLMDPDRRRVKKTSGTKTTYYLRGTDGSVLAEYDGKQALTARYVYAGTRRIARIGASGASYYLADHLGSTRALVDGSGTVTATYDYRPFGGVLASSGTGATHFRFTGHERDAESGLDYMLERSYAYDTSRFLRPDPMQDEYPGISPYAYAANNPLKYVDPDGRLVYSVNQKTGEILQIDDRGGSKVDYFAVGTTGSEGNFVTAHSLSVERGGGSIVSFRFGETERGTKSAFIVPESGQKGFFLEPPGPDTTMRDQNRRIPEGAYNLVRHRGGTFKDHFKLQNDKVPADRDIVIHKGNTFRDTKGCLVCGSELDGNAIPGGKSKAAFDELYSYIRSTGHTKLKFHIYNVFPEEDKE